MDTTKVANRARKGSMLQSGKASRYASKFQGRRTVSGERHNGGQLTAVHRTLPLGTRVRVTWLATGKSSYPRLIQLRDPYSIWREVAAFAFYRVRLALDPDARPVSIRTVCYLIEMLHLRDLFRKA
ncbi:septal ring lytic transglycosylase RlpA family protein [Paraburkholderia sp. J76]|uniref:septal ring lytic transglycosylase RlpA family protein n=1 Tax=Paraburkholderia sp. J76 TaxID=2805439 RepID=UPI002ABE0439|nr:septal ring lytic transglycosylase RlpA family protein [Paraburkholderia sp. J76]